MICYGVAHFCNILTLPNQVEKADIGTQLHGRVLGICKADRTKI